MCKDVVEEGRRSSYERIFYRDYEELQKEQERVLEKAAWDREYGREQQRNADQPDSTAQEEKDSKYAGKEWKKQGWTGRTWESEAESI